MKRPLPWLSNSRRLIAVIVLGMVLTGCRRDARLADHALRDPDLGPVTAYGKTLDPTARPQEVVYVLLRAIADDYAAGDDRAAREAALDTQFAISAADWIKQRMGGDRLTEQEQREQLYRVVQHWAPTLGFYRHDFTDEYHDLVQRMHVNYPLQASAKTEECTVYVNCTHPDPESAGPRSGAVAIIRLIRVDGYWRVGWVGFDDAVRDWRRRFPQVTPEEAADAVAPPDE
jgi:hypothetical protein